jgi:hypothetical protein
MAQATYSSGYDDLEELRRSFEEFRSKHPARTRFPEELWRAAVEMAKRRGVKSCLPEFAAGCGQLEEVDGRARQSRGADAKAKAHGDGDTCVYGADRSGIGGANELHVGGGSTPRREAAFRVESVVSHGVGGVDPSFC